MPHCTCDAGFPVARSAGPVEGSMEIRELTRDSELWQRRRETGRPPGTEATPFEDGAAPRLATGLAWISIGLGLLEVLAPHAVARVAGIDRTAGQRRSLFGG